MMRAAEDGHQLSETTSRTRRFTSTEGEQSYSERTRCGGNLPTATDVVTQVRRGLHIIVRSMSINPTVIYNK